MAIALPPLPYAYDALEPHMSAETIRVHHDVLQARYVAKTNELVRGTPLQHQSLLAVVDRATDELWAENADPYWEKLFNQASQAWNHALFWHCMKPDGAGCGDSARVTVARDAFVDQAAQAFGSGWVWLVAEGGSLRVEVTENAGHPSGTPLLVCDLWEHAYYLDYPGQRAEYMQVWLDELVDWDFAERMVAGEVPPELR